MKLFTVGPVEMYPETLKIEGTQLPYFRTAEFGNMMKEAAKLLEFEHAAFLRDEIAKLKGASS